MFTLNISNMFAYDMFEGDRLKGKVVYGPAIGKRTVPESADGTAWGDYRISIKEQKL